MRSRAAQAGGRAASESLGCRLNRSVSTDRAEEPLLKNRFVSIGLLKNKLASFKRAAVIPGTKEG